MTTTLLLNSTKEGKTMKKRSLILFFAAVFSVTAAFADKKGVMLRDNGSLWGESKDRADAFVWKTGIPAGTILTVEDKTVTKTLITSQGETKDTKFYPVSYNGKDYYVLPEHIAVDGKATVITAKALTFSEADFITFSETSLLEPGTIVAEGDTVTNGKFTFTQVTYMDGWSKKTVWALSSAVSANKNDLKAVMAINKIKANKDNDAMKATLIEEVNKLRCNGTFLQAVADRLELDVTFESDDYDDYDYNDDYSYDDNDYGYGYDDDDDDYGYDDYDYGYADDDEDAKDFDQYVEDYEDSDSSDYEDYDDFDW